MNPIPNPRSPIPALRRWLGASAFIHLALLAAVAGLALRAGVGREEVLKVTLITVEPQPSAPALQAPVPPAASSNPIPGAPGPEGAGRLGGDGRLAGARRPPKAPPAPQGGPAAPSAASASRERAPAEATAPAVPSVRAVSEQQAPRETASTAPLPALPPDAPVPAPPRVIAAAPLAPGPLDGPIHQELRSGGGGPSSAHPASSLGGSPGGSGAGKGLGSGEGRGLGAVAGPGSGVAGLGPGAGGAGLGPGDKAPARPLSTADLLTLIHLRIEAAKRYPEEARREGIQGSVAVRFRVREDGQVETAEVARSSGSWVLDEASLETIRRAAPFPPVRGWVQVPIAYTLTEGDR